MRSIRSASRDGTRFNIERLLQAFAKHSKQFAKPLCRYHRNASSGGLPNTSAIRNAHSRLGEYFPASSAAMVWRVTPTHRPNSSCVIYSTSNIFNMQAKQEEGCQALSPRIT